MALRSFLILRKPGSGCLEGRTALIRPVRFLHSLPFAGMTFSSWRSRLSFDEFAPPRLRRRRRAAQVAASAGRWRRKGVAFSKASATRKRVGSWNGLPTSWIATGRLPAPNPAHTEIAREAATVNRLLKIGAAEGTHLRK